MKYRVFSSIVLGLSFFISVIAQNKNTDSTIVLQEVVVNAYQVNTRLNQIPGSISLLSGKQINTADGNNFSNVLHSIPGIYMHSGTYATSRIIIRGVGSRTPYNTNRIKSYLNDIPITSSDGISTPEDIDLTGIGRVEVIKGPASALYGSGLGGNINLYTPVERNNSGRALIQYGEFNSLKGALALNYYRPNLGITTNISRFQSDGYRQNNHIKRTSLISAGQWRHSNYSIEYTLLLTDMNAGIPSSISKTLFDTNPNAAAANWNNIGGFKEYQRGLAGLTLDNKLSPRWNNRLTIFGRWVDSYEKRPFNNLDDSSVGGGVRNKLTYHTSKVDLLMELEWITDKYSWQMDLENELINKNAENRNHLKIFGMIYYRPAPKWNISVVGAVNSIHYRLTDEFSEDGNNSGKRNFPLIFSPRLGVNYLLNNNIALYTSVGHGFSMPSPEETLLPEGNINEKIKPEQGVQYEAGVRLNLFQNATQFEITLYQIELNNLLVTKRLTEDIFTGINAGRTRHSGIELMLIQQIIQDTSFPGNLLLNANYTFSHNKFIDFTDDGISYNGNQLPGIPSHIAQANLRWNPIDPLELYFQAQNVSSQFMNDANSLKNDGYFISNLKLTYNFHINNLGNISLFSGINNLFNEHYSPMITVNAVAFGNAEPRYYYPGMPRHWYIGALWRF